MLAEKDPHITMEVDADEMAGRPIPPELYRPSLSSAVLMAQHDRGGGRGQRGGEILALLTAPSDSAQPHSSRWRKPDSW